jgi:hypothetical protein
MSTKPIKTFNRQRTQDEIRKLCFKKGWKLDTRKYDLEGSDFITIYWKNRNRITPVVYSSFNGRFVASRNNEYFTESSKLDGTPWFDDLLAVLYVADAVEDHKHG